MEKELREREESREQGLFLGVGLWTSGTRFGRTLDRFGRTNPHLLCLQSFSAPRYGSS